MVTDWVEAELATVDLKHARRNQRLKQVVSDLAARPSVSIPAAVGGWTRRDGGGVSFLREPRG